MKAADIAYSFELIEQAEKLLAASREMLSTTRVLLKARNDCYIPPEWKEKPILRIVPPARSTKQADVLSSDCDVSNRARAA